MSMHFLSDSEVALLQRLLDAHRGQLGNTPSKPPTEHSWSDGEDHQAPEVYIAYPQDDPDSDDEGGTGTGTYWVKPPSIVIPGVKKAVDVDSYDEPGEGDCNLFKIVITDDVPELHPLGGFDNKDDYSKKVYNVSETSIADQYVLATRDKFGSWIALPSNRIVRCMLAEDHPGQGIKFKVWPGQWCPDEDKWRFNCQESGDTWDAIDWFYAATAITPAKYAQGFFQIMPSKYGRDGIVYDAIVTDCDSDDSCTDHELPCRDEDR